MSRTFSRVRAVTVPTRFTVTANVYCRHSWRAHRRVSQEVLRRDRPRKTRGNLSLTYFLDKCRRLIRCSSWRLLVSRTQSLPRPRTTGGRASCCFQAWAPSSITYVLSVIFCSVGTSIDYTCSCVIASTGRSVLAQPWDTDLRRSRSLASPLPKRLSSQSTSSGVNRSMFLPSYPF